MARDEKSENVLFTEILSTVREKVISGESFPEELSKLPCLQRVCDLIWRLQLPDVDEEQPTLQKELMSAIRSNGSAAIDADHNAAKITARKVLFKTAMDATFGTKGKLSDSKRISAGIHADLIRAPHMLVTEPTYAQYIADRMKNEGAVFLESLKQDFHNAERREERVPFDFQNAFLSRHWIDECLPLWLAGRAALVDIARGIAGGADTSWTENTIKKRLGKDGLSGPRSRPIKSFKRVSDVSIEIGVTPEIHRLMQVTRFESRIWTPDESQPDYSAEQSDIDHQRLVNCPPEKLPTLMKHLEKRDQFRSGLPVTIHALPAG